MAITTIYTCDLCGHQQDSPGPTVADQDRPHFMQVQIHVVDIGSFGHRTPEMKQLWCQNCLRSRRLYWRPKEPPPTPAPTLEDHIRDFVAAVVEETRNG